MKHIVLIATIIFLFTACKTEKPIDPFLISKQNIGLLTDSTQVRELDIVFANDSIVKHIGGDEFTGKINDIEVYEKGGKHLLTLSATEALDTTATISTVKIIDGRYKTEKGLHKLSTFKDIKDNYTISKIRNTLKNVVVFIDEANVYVSIDKKELPTAFQFDMNKTIEAKDIPDTAKIKYFMVGW